MTDRPEDQPVTPDTLLEVEPGIYKAFKDCSALELLMAGGQYVYDLEQAHKRDIDSLPTTDDER